MKILRSLTEIKEFKAKNKISFIPTMGNLHEGHLSLVREAHKYDNTILCSIFINPLQFNDSDDFKRYPKTIEQDIENLVSVKCDAIFIPEINILENIQEIEEPKKAKYLCGKNRPGHFKGVLTIINKFLSIIEPDLIILGLKDYQQFIIIKDFIFNNFKDINIIGVKTFRDKNGLAMSSRNNHLLGNDKKLASELYKCLKNIKKNKLYESHEALKKETIKLERYGFRVDYLTACDPFNFMTKYTLDSEGILVAVAAYLKKVRLIDNILIKK